MKHKISLKKLKGIPETLLIPLRGRYLETKRRNSIIKDHKSVNIIDTVEHSFAELELPWDDQMMVSVRTEILDEAVGKFLEKNPDSVIVNLGSGLCTRFGRIDNGKVLWYDLDLAECIEIRKHFFEETERHKFISKSVLDFSWVDEIAKSKKSLFVAEGLFNYFTEDQVKSIFNAIKENFPEAELIFEVHSRILARLWHRHPHIKNAYSHFKWGINKGKHVEKWDDSIKFLQEWRYFDRHIKRWRWMRFFRFIPTVRRLLKVVHICFKTEPEPAKTN